jgi:hypothetical protein
MNGVKKTINLEVEEEVIVVATKITNHYHYVANYYFHVMIVVPLHYAVGIGGIHWILFLLHQVSWPPSQQNITASTYHHNKSEANSSSSKRIPIQSLIQFLLSERRCSSLPSLASSTPAFSVRSSQQLSLSHLICQLDYADGYTPGALLKITKTGNATMP